MAAIQRREYVGAASATTLASSINNSTTTITIASGTGWPTGATGPFFIVIDRGQASEEKILCDSRTGTTITANASGRGSDDTSAASHDSGATVEHVVTAQDMDDFNRVAAALTTKGDILSFTTEPARQAVGADDTFLVADSGEATGLDWKTPTEVADLLDGVVKGTPLWARKTADESVTNSDTLQDDDHLVVALEANAEYVFEGAIFVTAGTWQGGFTVPTGATIIVGIDSSILTSSGAATASAFAAKHVKGHVSVGGTSGNLQHQWAQESASGTATTVAAGSWLERIA